MAAIVDIPYNALYLKGSCVGTCYRSGKLKMYKSDYLDNTSPFTLPSLA